MFWFGWAVHHRVAHVLVRVGHVYLGPQNMRAVGELPGPHAAEQVQVLLHRAVAVGAVTAGLRPTAPVAAYLFGAEAVHIRLALDDELLGVPVHLLEVVRGEVEPVAPVHPEPPQVLDERVHVVLAFGERVGVVEAQVEQPPEVPGDAVVYPCGLRVAYVRVGVWLRRKARVDPASEPAGGEVLAYYLPDEVRAPAGWRALASGVAVCAHRAPGTVGMQCPSIAPCWRPDD